MQKSWPCLAIGVFIIFFTTFFSFFLNPKFNSKNFSKMFVTRIRVAREVTLALIKPTVTSSPTAVSQILKKLNSIPDISILAAKKVEFTPKMTEQFYGEHFGKFFYPRWVFNVFERAPRNRNFAQKSQFSSIKIECFFFRFRSSVRNLKFWSIIPSFVQKAVYVIINSFEFKVLL